MKIKLLVFFVLLAEVSFPLSSHGANLSEEFKRLKAANYVQVRLLYPFISYRSQTTIEILAKNKGEACIFSATEGRKINDLVDILSGSDIMAKTTEIRKNYGPRMSLAFFEVKNNERYSIGALILGQKFSNSYSHGELILPPVFPHPVAIEAEAALTENIYRWTSGVEVEVASDRHPEQCKDFASFAIY